MITVQTYQVSGRQSHDNAAIPEKVAYQKSAQDWRETEKNRVKTTYPEIKGTASINKCPDGKKGLDSANIFSSKYGSQPDTKNDYLLG